ncbi:hypothetical protein AVEN_192709-1 [Araneus ventricosus]|uniref:Uncharacterized protein n=1 Tax=Araneus ventricosus TaxID=182803 RepID=A0A4Y2UEU9_ARAVE|nr:hypothetical protein AVEN_192709-1 [Araneus ventricosus]
MAAVNVLSSSGDGNDRRPGQLSCSEQAPRLGCLVSSGACDGVTSIQQPDGCGRSISRDDQQHQFLTPRREHPDRPRCCLHPILNLVNVHRF